jgi:hypothetical protein
MQIDNSFILFSSKLLQDLRITVNFVFGSQKAHDHILPRVIFIMFWNGASCSLLLVTSHLHDIYSASSQSHSPHKFGTRLAL